MTDLIEPLAILLCAIHANRDPAVGWGGTAEWAKPCWRDVARETLRQMDWAYDTGSYNCLQDERGDESHKHHWPSLAHTDWTPND